MIVHLFLHQHQLIIEMTCGELLMIRIPPLQTIPSAAVFHLGVASLMQSSIPLLGKVDNSGVIIYHLQQGVEQYN